MAHKSSIEWTEATWNPTTGCDRTSPGCDNCYALTLAKRLKAMALRSTRTTGILERADRASESPRTTTFWLSPTAGDCRGSSS